jgi:hypothetical protein
METLHYLDLSIKLQEDRVHLFGFFLFCLTFLNVRRYWLRIMDFPKFQAQVSIPMVLLEVIEALPVIDLDSSPISLIDYVLCDISKVI